MREDVKSPELGGLAQLLEQHRPELRRFLTARCANPDDADEILQELWIKLAELNPGPIGNGRAYLFRMANNLVLMRFRASQRAMARDRSWLIEAAGGDADPEQRPDPDAPADEVIARDQEAKALQHAIDQLPAGAQRALRLYRFDGHGQSEIARIMGISRSGVEKHLATAMKSLRNTLADWGMFNAAASHQQGETNGRRPRLDRTT